MSASNHFININKMLGFFFTCYALWLLPRKSSRKQCVVVLTTTEVVKTAWIIVKIAFVFRRDQMNIDICMGQEICK